VKAADHDSKIILWMHQVHAPAIPIIQSIPDMSIRERLFSFFYYMSEMEFSAHFSYYIPPRLLTGDSIENVTQWGNSARDFTDARSQLLDSMSHYATTRRGRIWRERRV